jgi:hypothetical protein
MGDQQRRRAAVVSNRRVDEIADECLGDRHPSVA